MPAPCPRCSRSDAGCVPLPGQWVACRSSDDVPGWACVRGYVFRPAPAVVAPTAATSSSAVQPALVQPEKPPASPAVAAEVAAEVSVVGKDDRRALERLRSWIARHGGTATPRQLQRSYSRRYTSPQAAEEELNRLVASGAGIWTTRSVVRHVRVFALAPEVRTAHADDAADGSVSGCSAVPDVSSVEKGLGG
jgi:hypothetical protein